MTYGVMPIMPIAVLTLMMGMGPFVSMTCSNCGLLSVPMAAEADAGADTDMAFVLWLPAPPLPYLLRLSPSSSAQF